MTKGKKTTFDERVEIVKYCIAYDLERYHGLKSNDKRVLRICRKKGIKSTIKYSNNGCTRRAVNPQYIARTYRTGTSKYTVNPKDERLYSLWISVYLPPPELLSESTEQEWLTVH